MNILSFCKRKKMINKLIIAKGSDLIRYRWTKIENIRNGAAITENKSTT